MLLTQSSSGDVVDSQSSSGDVVCVFMSSLRRHARFSVCVLKENAGLCHSFIQRSVGMHRNENSWPKPNKMKHWAEGRIPNTVFSKKLSLM